MVRPTLTLAALAALAALAGADLVVQTDKGAVRGHTVGGADVWTNVPFATPPTAENGLRYRAPVPATTWDGELDCTTPTLGSACAQIDVDNHFYGQEDCLYLHIYRPAGVTDANLPVMVWIFGGAFVLGDGDEFGMYNGTRLAEEHNVIVVTPNYRVGAFGFLAIEALQHTDPNGSTGNMAMMDQRLALQWVQTNIAAFGGDPSLVTLFGESAGGFSVCQHLGNGNFPGLFGGVIMESGSCSTPEFFYGIDKAFRLGNKFVDIVGCNHSLSDADMLACLDGKSTADLMLGTLAVLFKYSPIDVRGNHHRWNQRNHDPKGHIGSSALGYFEVGKYPTLTPVFPFGPVVDGTAVGTPMVPLDAMHAGKHVKVPLLTGSNHDEGTIFVPAIGFVVPNTTFPPQEDDLEKALHWMLDPVTGGKDIQPILDLYPSGDFPTLVQREAVAIRDYIFLCPTRRAVRAVTDQGHDAFLYQFVYRDNTPLMMIFGDFHASELKFVFNHGILDSSQRFDENDQKMADTFGLYWTNFAKYRTPNGPPDGYTDEWCSWDGEYGKGHGFCAPSVLCSYQPQDNDESKDDSCRLKHDLTNSTWPLYSQSSEGHMVMDVPSAVGYNLNHDVCDAWDDFLDSY